MYDWDTDKARRLDHLLQLLNIRAFPEFKSHKDLPSRKFEVMDAWLLWPFYLFSSTFSLAPFSYVAKLDGVSEKARQRLAEHDSINDWLEIADEDDKNETNGRKKKRVSYMISSTYSSGFEF